VLKAEKKKLREHRARDFEDNRARFSAATEDAVSRVLMLEELLDGTAGQSAAPSQDNTLHLEGGGA
jgi:hypothetical protein